MVKQLPDDTERDTILAIDGSPQSFGALMTAIDLARHFGKKVEAIAVYDPYLHYTVFNGIVNVLSESAAKVFRFEEQNQLHEEVIDTGLAQIYLSHLEVAAKMAADVGVDIRKTLLDGKAFQKVLNHARTTSLWLLVVGCNGIQRQGRQRARQQHRELPATRRATYCSRRGRDPRARRAGRGVDRWTPESEERMKRVPELVRASPGPRSSPGGREGHSVINSDLLDEAMERYMPKGAKASTQLAERLVLDHAKEKAVSICKRCGISAVESNPVACAVCGGNSFQVISPEMVEQIIASEGGAAAETTYDGRKLVWTRAAKLALWTIRDGYKRRRTKARIEKAARIRRLDTVGLEFAQAIIEEETGVPLVMPEEGEPAPPAETQDGKKLIARDAKRTPLFSEFAWATDAAARILRVPAGFMRNRTQQRVEQLASERSIATIDLALVEEGIEHGRQAMEEMIKNAQPGAPVARQAMASAREAMASANESRPRPASSNGLALNEVGVMAVMEARRRNPDEK